MSRHYFVTLLRLRQWFETKSINLKAFHIKDASNQSQNKNFVNLSKWRKKDEKNLTEILITIINFIIYFFACHWHVWNNKQTEKKIFSNFFNLSFILIFFNSQRKPRMSLYIFTKYTHYTNKKEKLTKQHHTQKKPQSRTWHPLTPKATFSFIPPNKYGYLKGCETNSMQFLYISGIIFITTRTDCTTKRVKAYISIQTCKYFNI